MKGATGVCKHSRCPLVGFFFASFVPRGAHQLESGGTLMRVVGGLSFQSWHANGGVCMVQMLFWMDMCGMVDSGGWEVGGCWLGKGNLHVVREGGYNSTQLFFSLS